MLHSCQVTVSKQMFYFFKAYTSDFNRRYDAGANRSEPAVETTYLAAVKN